MNGGCEGCATSGESQDIAFASAVVKAKIYAEEHKTAVAIYKEGFEYKFIDAARAIRGNFPIRNIISQYS